MPSFVAIRGDKNSVSSLLIQGIPITSDSEVRSSDGQCWDDLQTVLCSSLECAPEFQHAIAIHDIYHSGLPNFLGCRIPVQSNMNVNYFRDMLVNYQDPLVCELLEFVCFFPVGFLGDITKGRHKVKNHNGAPHILCLSINILLYKKK